MYPALDHPWLDATEAPLIIIRFPAEAADDELHAYEAALRRFYAELREPMICLVDGSAVKSVSATQRRIMADIEKTLAEPMKRYIRGTALVLPNALVRGAVTAIYWLAPPPYPHTVVATEAEARRWLEERRPTP